MTVRLLLAGIAENDSSVVARLLAHIDKTWDFESRDLQVDTLRLPRRYGSAGNLVQGSLDGTDYDLFLLMDQDRTTAEWRLEVFAANFDDSPEPDADGRIHQDHIIDPDGPVAYRNHLPLDGIWDKFVVERVPSRMSHKAGGHVFNHVYYRAMRALDLHDKPTLGGAVQVPATTGDELEDDEPPRSFDAVAEELVMVLSVLRQLYPAALKAKQDDVVPDAADPTID